MQKKITFSIVLFLAVLVSILIVGCSNKPISEPDGLVEILRMSPECGTENTLVDKCCMDQCTSFCSENNLKYQKHSPNNIHCGCWCG
jgi:hypothetical protein